MNKIYLDTAGRMHRAYKLVYDYPPAGYDFIDDPGVVFSIAGNLLKKKYIVYPYMEVLCKLLPMNLLKANARRFSKIPSGTDLTYSCGHLIFRPEPWVVEVEWPTQLSGFYMKHLARYRGTIERSLGSHNCRAVLCMSELTKQTVLHHLNCSGFPQKVETIYRAVPSQPMVKTDRNDGIVKLLFVGSANIPGEFEDEKGGKEALEAFLILNNKYSNLQLTIRSDVPSKVKADIAKVENIKLIDHTIPWKEMEAEFLSADIFLLPAHHTPSLTFLDAMSYELPVVTIDSWANSEIVEDGKTGLVAYHDREDWVPVADFLPEGITKPFKRGSRPISNQSVQSLVKNTSKLIESETLRKQLGKAGRWEIENGKFSIETRNRKFKDVLDRAIANKD